MISVATPSAMPTSEKIAMIETKPLALARAQVAEGDGAFEGVEHRRAVSRRGCARWRPRGETSARSPVARRFSSTGRPPRRAGRR